MNDTKTRTYYIGCGPIGCFLFTLAMFIIIIGAWKTAEWLLNIVF